MELSFGQALQALRYQRRVRRCSWPADVWLRLERPEGLAPYIDIHHPPHTLDLLREGPMWLWHPSHTDLLSEDWEVVKSE